jgi:hypothetical protein
MKTCRNAELLLASALDGRLWASASLPVETESPVPTGPQSKFGEEKSPAGKRIITIKPVAHEYNEGPIPAPAVI